MKGTWLMLLLLGVCVYLFPKLAGQHLEVTKKAVGGYQTSYGYAQPAAGASAAEDTSELGIATAKWKPPTAPAASVGWSMQSRQTRTTTLALPAVRTLARRAQASCREHRRPLLAVIWGVPFALCLGAGVSLGVSRFSWARSAGGASFRLASSLLVLLSAACILAYLLGTVNLLVMLPAWLWAAPVVFLLVSAFLMRLVDLNYPFWNRTISSLILPLLAVLVVFGWHHLDRFIQRR
jgi:hypothetical protein